MSRDLTKRPIFIVCCSVLQCVAVCCSVLQCAAVCCSVLQYVKRPYKETYIHRVLQCAAVCCSVLQCVAVCCSVLQCAAVCQETLQRDLYSSKRDPQKRVYICLLSIDIYYSLLTYVLFVNLSFFKAITSPNRMAERKTEKAKAPTQKTPGTRNLATQQLRIWQLRMYV